MNIIPVQSAYDRDRFIKLPKKIYRNDPNWTPQFDFLEREKLDPKKNPFFQHGWAQAFLAVEGDEVLGRILVADDDRFNQENNSNVGTFGFYESINDQQVANALFDAGMKLLKEERKRDSVFGPVEFSTNYQYALLVDGYDSPAKIMMPYNPSYYQTLFETWGLEKNRDLFSWYFDRSAIFAEQWRPIIERLQKRYNFTVRQFVMKDFERDVQKCMEVYDNVRSEWWWASVSLTEAEIAEYAKTIRAIASPKMILIAESEGKPIGFSITVPDLNEAAKPLNGSLSWFGIPYLGVLRLKSRLKYVKGARMMVLCVLPEYRRKGVAEKLILDTFDAGTRDFYFDNAELGWTDEYNDKITQVLERVGAKKFKTYRVYQKNI